MSENFNPEVVEIKNKLINVLHKYEDGELNRP